MSTTSVLRQRSIRVNSTGSEHIYAIPVADDGSSSTSSSSRYLYNASNCQSNHDTDRSSHKRSNQPDPRTSYKESAASELTFPGSSRYGNLLHKCMLVLGVVLVAAPWMNHSSMSWQVKVMKERIEELNKEQKLWSRKLEDNLSELKNMKTKNKIVDDENSAILHVLDQQGNNNFKSYRDAAHREDAYMVRIDEIQKEIKRLSISNINEKYASHSKIRVKVTLKQDVLKGSIVHELKNDIKGDTFTILLRPIDLFPHAVDVFLQLVNEKFYENTILLHRDSSSTILQTIPEKNQGNSESNIEYQSLIINNAQPTIESKNARQLAFLEKPQPLNEKTTRTNGKYSVCFKDKGPNIYINMQNEINRDEIDEKDVCFGSIKDGRAVVEFIMRTNSNNNSNNKLQIIGIESMQIIQPEYTVSVQQ